MNYRITIRSGNGYQSQKIEVRNVVNQAAARKVAEAQYPGANLGAIMPFS